MNILTLDLGTGSLKAIVFDDQLNELASSNAAIKTLRDPYGRAEQNVEDWLKALKKAAPKAIDQAGVHIDAISFTGHMSAPCLISEDKEALAPVQTLADYQCEPYVNRDEQTPALTGNHSASYFGRAKIAYMLDKYDIKDGINNIAAKILAPKGVLRLAMGGDFITDPSDAANFLWIDPGTNRYSDHLLKAAKLSPTLLPELRPANAISGHLNGEWAKRLKLPKGIPLITGAGDMATAALAGGVEQKGRLITSIGTSATTLIECQKPIKNLIDRLTFHSTGTGINFVLGSHFNGGACLDWFYNLFGKEMGAKIDVLNTLSDKALKRQCANSDPMFISSILGAGSPDFDASERGAFLNLSAHHDQVDMFKAMLEGINFEIARTINLLANQSINAEYILANGGGMKLSLWPQLLADITNLPVHIAATANVSAQGAAILALDASKLSIPTEKKPIEIAIPNKETYAHYQERLNKFTNLRKAIKTVKQL